MRHKVVSEDDAKVSMERCMTGKWLKGGCSCEVVVTDMGLDRIHEYLTQSIFISRNI